MINAMLMNRAANNIRILAATMVENAKSGHPGGAMGGADFVNVLYSKFLVTDPDDPRWFARDRFFLDPGHMSPMLYSVLHLTGKYTTDDLKAFRQWGSITPGHPEVDVEHGVENTSGPLKRSSPTSPSFTSRPLSSTIRMLLKNIGFPTDSFFSRSFSMGVSSRGMVMLWGPISVMP